MAKLLLAGILLLWLWFGLEYICHAQAEQRGRIAALAAAAVSAGLALLLCATVLVIAGVYSLWLLGAVLALLLVPVKLYMWRHKGVPLFSAAWLAGLKDRKRPSLPAVLSAIIICMVSALYLLHPTNYLLGSRDPGLYLVHAVHISETGSMQYENDEWLSDTYEDGLDAFLKADYPGLYSTYAFGISDNPGEISPQFMPMLPAVLAAGYDLGGFTLMLRVPGLYTALALVALYYLARRFGGRWAAMVTVLFFGVCPAILWGARITQSEQPALLLFFAAAWCIAKGLEEGKRPCVTLGAFLVAVGSFNRIDNYVLFIALYAVVCYCALWDHKKLRLLLPGAGIMTATGLLAVWYTFQFHTVYTLAHIQLHVLDVLWFGSLAALAAAVALVLLRLLVLKEKRLPDILGLIQKRRVAAALALLLVCGLGAMYFVYPALFGGASILQELGWYISPLAYVLAILGLWAYVRHQPPEKIRGQLFLLLSGMGCVALYTFSSTVTADHFWGSRRWVPVNFPFLLLLAAYGVVWLWKAKANKVNWRSLPGRIGALAAACFVAVYMLWNDRLFLFTRMLGGLEHQYAQVAGALPEDTLAVAGPAEIASVLRYVYGKPVYLLRGYHAGESWDEYNLALQSGVAEYLAENGEIYIIGSPLRFWQLGTLTQVYEGAVKGVYPERSVGYYPQELITEYINTDVYRLSLEQGPRSVELLEEMSATAAAVRAEGEVRLDTQGTVLYGPYISLEPGEYRLELDVSTPDGTANALLEVYTDSGAHELTQLEITQAGTAIVRFSTAVRLEYLEFHLVNLGQESISCTRVQLYEE